MRTKSVISWCILIFISALFAFKYLPRYIDYGELVALAIVVAQVVILVRGGSMMRRLNKGWFYLLCGAVIAGVTAVAIISIGESTLNVDRWSVIDAFLSEMFKGEYPYMAKSHMDNYPGPMPVYFVIAAPFYLLGDLSILSAVGFLAAVIYLFRRREDHPVNAAALVLLMTSFYMYWEVLVRSNVFTYSLLVLAIMVAFDRISPMKRGLQVLTAIGAGLLLSTRSIFILVYFIFFLVPLRSRDISAGRWFLLKVIVAISFLATFVPFLIFFPQEFMEVNPFVIQSSIMIPVGMVSIFVLMSLLASLVAQNSIDKFYFSGVVLFLSILIYALYQVAVSGFHTAFVDSDIDISYFIFAVPFLMYYVVNADRVDSEFAPAGILPV